MPNYSWLTFAQAKTQLAQRLATITTVANTFWTDAELGIYIQQSLRMFNALTWTWKQDFAYMTNGPGVWSSLATLTGSPRLRTLTDTYLYTEMENMLLEPPTGGVWTGTSMFTIGDLSNALQGSRDEMLQVSACNDTLIPGIPLTPFTNRNPVPDTVIDIPRLRYIPVGSLRNTGVTLYRDDTVALEFYDAPLYQLNPTLTPETYSLSSEPPLAFDVYPPPATEGTYEAIALQSGAAFNPPTSTLIGIPDDFGWALEFGAMAELLGRESEATDRERAEYCTKRYQDGMNLLLKTPWIMLGKVNGAAVTIDALAAVDRYYPNWDSDPSGFGPMIVTAGIDFLAAPINAGIGVTVLGNAPVPSANGDPLQVSRSNWDTVLDLAQARASFKMGGDEWKQALELEQRAIQSCSAENSRLRSTGSFGDVLAQRGQLQDFNQNRYNSKKS